MARIYRLSPASLASAQGLAMRATMKNGPEGPFDQED
jgi:hypothetical protein